MESEVWEPIDEIENHLQCTFYNTENRIYILFSFINYQVTGKHAFSGLIILFKNKIVVHH
jgi:hypothetical protein